MHLRSFPGIRWLLLVVFLVVALFAFADGVFTFSPDTYLSNADGGVNAGQTTPLLGEQALTPLPPWTYIFKDPRRGTELRINTSDKTFQFLAPDGYDSGVIHTSQMSIRNGNLRFTGNTVDLATTFQFRADLDKDRCSGSAVVRQSAGKPRFERYRVHDPVGFE